MKIAFYTEIQRPNIFYQVCGPRSSGPSCPHLAPEIIGATPYPGQRHMNMESIYEYGSRAGFWRLHRMFTQRNVPCTGECAGPFKTMPRRH